MEPLVIIEWLLLFIIFLFVQAIFINGMKTSMDGETQILPNGKHKDSEMIFYPFYKWLTQMATAPKKIIYYEGVQHKVLCEKLYAVYKDLMPGTFDPNATKSYLEFQSDAEVEKMKFVALKILRELGISTDIDGRHVRFFQDYDNYKFSKWIRKPLGQCIKCMASAYSIIPFWSVALYTIGWNWLLVPVYMANVICLAYVNYLIFKK